MMLSGHIYEERVPPVDERLAAEARLNPGGWVYDLDFAYSPDEVPPSEAIRGAWEVSESGTLSGRYKKNERYRPIIKCARVLKPYMHAAAKRSPGKWVSEIDSKAEKLFPNIPEELIVGWWLIDKFGNISQNFRENSLYANTGGSSLP